MTLGAVRDNDVSQADSKEEAGYPRGNPPMMFGAVRPIISVGLKVHIALFEVSIFEQETVEIHTPRLDQVLQ